MPHALKLGRSACARLVSAQPNFSWCSTPSCHRDGTEIPAWRSWTLCVLPLPLNKSATRRSPWGQPWIGGSMSHRAHTTRQPIESRSRTSATPGMSEEPFSEPEMIRSQLPSVWQSPLGTGLLRIWMTYARSVSSERHPGSLEGWCAGSATVSTEDSYGSTEKSGEITLPAGAMVAPTPLGVSAR